MVNSTVSDFPAFRPRLPWVGGDLQTLRNTLRPPRLRSAATPQVLRFPMQDGTGDVLVGVLDRPERPALGCPLALLVHGLTGSAESAYMRVSTAALLKGGHSVLRLNLRGAGGTRPLCRQLYHAGRTEDLRRVIEALPAPLLEAGLMVVGYSLGGNCVLKMLGEGAPAVVRAGASISAPIDLRATSIAFLRPRNRFYHRHLLLAMKAEALAGPLEPGEPAVVAAVRDTWEFDDRFIAPRNGWSGAEEYYAVNSAARYLDAIRVPTLVIHALDDPWIPGRIYAARDWSRNPSLVPLVSRRGGHVGFHGAGRTTWHDECLLRFAARLPD
ncbi:YheT family hydrolase [Arenibaculum pallidiluteum]|uniref:YheT family hydrolase n=1 Tax=Arenibaculum pallidiluteum TaxID=2812559 RepID=UPI001F480FDE|nr:alpha/beta fold hydrolase [Arenibaculum pallidiluteum]